MKLYLVQHGEALSKDQDPDRPLSDQGRRDVERLAEFVRRLNIRLGRILHSGKTRARQTAELLAAAMDPEPVSETGGGLAPNDPAGPWTGRLADATDDLLIAGHLPFLAKLVSLLLTGREDPVIAGFFPGTLVCLERDGDGAWTIAWMLRPEIVKRET